MLLTAALVAIVSLLAMLMSQALTSGGVPDRSTESEHAEQELWILEWCHGIIGSFQGQNGPTDSREKARADGHEPDSQHDAQLIMGRRAVVATSSTHYVEIHAGSAGMIADSLILTVFAVLEHVPLDLVLLPVSPASDRLLDPPRTSAETRVAKAVPPRQVNSKISTRS
jgi:hypothetical protein